MVEYCLVAEIELEAMERTLRGNKIKYEKSFFDIIRKRKLKELAEPKTGECAKSLENWLREFKDSTHEAHEVFDSPTNESISKALGVVLDKLTELKDHNNGH